MSQLGTLVADERMNSSLDIKSDLECLGYAIPGLASFREEFLSEHTRTRVKTRVMVVEDEGIVALDIRRNLQDLGYEVAGVASSGEQAIEKVAEELPNLVLMDIRLQGKLDGIDAAGQIRARFDIPIVYLTAHADEATLQRAKLTEPFGYLLKPFEERELQTTIELALYRHKMERKLRESEQWLATTLRSINDAVIATDNYGHIKFMNPVAEALTGWSQAEALDEEFQRVFRIIDTESRNRIECPVARSLREQRAVGLGDHVLLIARDGGEIPIDDSAAPILDDQNNIVGVVIVFRDISERVKANKTLQQHALELQAYNDDLNAFAHTVAHDLKAPLNPLVGFADFLLKESEQVSCEEQREYLQIIAQSGHKISNIVEELLLLAQVRTAEVKTGPLAMGAIVREARQRLSFMVKEYQAEIHAPPTWPLAIGYGSWIEEVWTNYISNGLKYGGQPPRLQLGATEQADGMIRFWVRDNGPGLTIEEQARLFQPFTQLSQIRATGHGLGLSIVRRIVEKLGGQVGVKSAVGQGSVFSFTLPAAPHEIQDGKT